MVSPLKRKKLHAQAARIALIDAADDAAAASDLLTLLYWAGVGMGQEHGSAVARGAMLAHDHLVAVRDRIREAREEIRPPNQPPTLDREGIRP